MNSTELENRQVPKREICRIKSDFVMGLTVEQINTSC